jgi:hypothetical protein
MSYETIRARLRQQPFVPFCVVTSSGERYEVRHPEMALATKAELAIALPDEDGVPSRLQWLATLHVTALEPLDKQTA